MQLEILVENINYFIYIPITSTQHSEMNPQLVFKELDFDIRPSHVHDLSYSGNYREDINMYNGKK